jgi:hypothetical protein
MLDNLPADLGEPKGEEVGVADLLSGFPVEQLHQFRTMYHRKNLF